jgi:hypothetical protein
MNVDQYRNKIAAMLRRPDIVMAGTAAELAAHCIHILSESMMCEDETRRLEEMAGIGLDPVGNYVDLDTPDPE